MFWGTREYIREQQLAECLYGSSQPMLRFKSYLQPNQTWHAEAQRRDLESDREGLRISAETLYVQAGSWRRHRGDGTVTAALLSLTRPSRIVSIGAARDLRHIEAENAATDSLKLWESGKNGQIQ